MKDPRPKVHSRTAFNQRNIYHPSETSQPTELSAFLLPCRLWQPQHWRDDSTGPRYTIRPLVSCERCGWLRSAAANVITSRSVLERNPPVRYVLRLPKRRA